MTTCIIVDDERPARDLIQLHLSGLQDFELLSTFDNALDAFNFLQRSAVDLIFLDIQMPKLSGLELIKSLQFRPKVILTTAFREHAVEAYELDVLDYLIKPVTQERFMKAISKFTYYKNIRPEKTNIPNSFDNAYIFLKVGKENTRIFLTDILYIEGFKDYIKVHTPEKVFVAFERLSNMEEKLPENKFARIHKSFIVALDKITTYNSEQIKIGDQSLSIGRIFRNNFLKKMQTNTRGQNKT
jgi:DNA-binding LytR/AlgR family response regulator